jgi:DNA-directed RNA polymerase specialized sigma24 family protein
MSDEGSVTHLVKQLKTGDPDAAAALWERYFPSLVRLAQARLRAAPRSRAADGEDVALSVLDGLCRRAQEGNFPELNDRGSLWRWLLVATAHKAGNIGKRERRHKRGGGNVRHISALPAGESDEGLFIEMISREPDPAFAAQVTEEYQRLLDSLGTEDQLRQVALMKLEGATNQEIATKLDCSLSTVERKLK